MHMKNKFLYYQLYFSYYLLILKYKYLVFKKKIGENKCL